MEREAELVDTNKQKVTEEARSFGPGQTTSRALHALSVDLHSKIAKIVRKYLLRSERGFEEAEARHKPKIDIGEGNASDGNRGRECTRKEAKGRKNLHNTVVPNPPPSQFDAVANEGLLHDLAQLRRLLLHKQHEAEFLVAAMRDRTQNEAANTNNQAVRAAQRVGQDTSQFGNMSASDIVNTLVEQAEMSERLSRYLDEVENKLETGQNRQQGASLTILVPLSKQSCSPTQRRPAQSDQP
ncbi:hypothetical protein BLNAU_3550 [Blattamonas nauphoetae]|uniref:Uncharacterized protein n=1 Tax=Blattamonas nauphoetae TaxID=2049346 RepID=A0ABQ9YCV5_9EUKA|nr:hypothetical protein BLNAU_3550 [Blattamonas nauphoetae]